jgi:hypothetical protein
VGLKKVKCITVEDTSHTFLVSHCSVTKNSAGGGKVVFKGQNVLGPNGWIPVEDLRVGCKVLGKDGKVQEIKHLFAWETLPVWEIEFDDGTVLDTAENHQWHYWLSRNGPSRFVVKSTAEMWEHAKKSNRTPIIPTPDPVEFYVKPVGIDPYTVGVFLGDGCLVNKSISFTCHKDDWDHYKNALPFEDKDLKRSGFTVRVIGESRQKLVSYFESVGLIGTKSNSKFVPQEFLFNSVEVRKDVLRGLLDTDGYRDKGRARAEFSTVSKRLAEDVKFLAQSLGYRVSTYHKVGSYKNEINEKILCQDVYRVYITGHDVDDLFKLPRKKIGVFGKQVGRKVVDVRKTNRTQEGRCISVSNADGLYITDGFVVTHNSYAMVADPVRYMNNEHANMLLVRRTTEELRELIAVSKKLYPKAIPGIKFMERDKTWIAPSGATLWMSYLDRDDDVTRYQGQAFNWIGFDELTQWPTPHAWNYMRSRLRTSKGSGLGLYQRATSNPGGSGHCLTHGEVLTPDRGWVDITQMQKGDKVYSVDSSGKLFETFVDHTYKEWIEEDIVQVKARGLYMSITQDHKVAKVGGTRENKGAQYTLVPFSDLPGQATVLRSVSFDGKELSFVEIEHSGGRKRKLEQPHVIPVNDYAALVGWYVSEGCRVHRDKAINIAQSKPEGRKAIAELLDRIGFSYSVSEHSFTVYCPSLYEHMGRYGDLCRNKKLTQEFKNFPVDALQAFFDAAMMGDGSGPYYYTTSKQLSDDFQEVAIKLGRIVYCGVRQKENRKGLSYEVSTKQTKSGGTEILTGHHLYNVNTETKKSSDVKKVPYSGYVYCIGVPETHTFVARQNGSVWVSGNTWVKNAFVDPETPGKAFWAKDFETGKTLTWPSNSEYAKRKGLVGEPMFKRRFIPATLFDNPYLAEDGMYEANLLSLPEHQRRQLLEGDWDINEGAAFPEFNRKTHVIEPFDIPENWPRFRAADYGYSSYSAVVWFAVTPADQLVVYRELYVSKVLATDLADMVLEAEHGEKMRYGVLDSSLWHKRGDTGPSLAEQMNVKGCRWRPSDRSAGSRVAGKNELHRRLQVDDFTKEPRIVFFNTCKNLIAQLPSIPLDKNNPEDVDTKSEDHLYDALRYGIMTRPRSGLFDADASWNQNNYRPADSVFGY